MGGTLLGGLLDGGAPEAFRGAARVPTVLALALIKVLRDWLIGYSIACLVARYWSPYD
jgi:hypothetical protein